MGFAIFAVFSHFPVLQNNQLIGLISEESIKDLEENEKEIGYFQYLFSHFHIQKNSNLLDVLGVFQGLRYTVLNLNRILEKNYKFKICPFSSAENAF